MSWLVRATILAVVTTLVGCASDGGETPKRPPLAVPDEVTAINRGQLVGTWQCHELNPYPQMPKQMSRTTYNSDGTFLTEAQSQGQQALGPIAVKVTGKWAVQGDEIVGSDVKTEAGSTDAFTNAIAGIGTSLVNSMGHGQTQGTGNVLKLTAHELVMRPTGIDDPPTIACTR